MYVSFTEAYFAGRWGSEQQQVEVFERALQGQIYGDALPQSIRRAALEMLLRLHARRQDLGRARATLAQLDPNLRALPANLRLNEELALLATDARGFKTAGKLSDNRAWLLPLLKRRFVVSACWKAEWRRSGCAVIAATRSFLSTQRRAMRRAKPTATANWK